MKKIIATIMAAAIVLSLSTVSTAKSSFIKCCTIETERTCPQNPKIQRALCFRANLLRDDELIEISIRLAPPYHYSHWEDAKIIEAYIKENQEEWEEYFLETYEFDYSDRFYCSITGIPDCEEFHYVGVYIWPCKPRMNDADALRAMRRFRSNKYEEYYVDFIKRHISSARHPNYVRLSWVTATAAEISRLSELDETELLSFHSWVSPAKGFLPPLDRSRYKIQDALEILKYLADMSSAYDKTGFRPQLIYALEILKHLSGMDTILQ